MSHRDETLLRLKNNYFFKIVCETSMSSVSLNPKFLALRLKLCWGMTILVALNPLNPRIDQHVTSPYYIYTLFSKQVMRILKLNRHKLLS